MLHRFAILLLVLLPLLQACSQGKPPDRTLEVAVQGLYSGALSGDGNRAVVGSIVHGGSLWELDSSERRWDWNHAPDARAEITAAAFSPEGRFAVTVEFRDLVLWDVETGEGLRYFAAPSEILSVDLTPQARYAVLGLVDHTAVLFDIRNGGVLRRFQHGNRVRSVSLSADGRRLMTGSEDRSARLWDVETGEELFRWNHRESVRLVELSDDGSRGLSVSKYDRAAVWNALTGEEIGTVPLLGTAVQRGMTFTAARFSANGDRLLTGTSDRTVYLWEAFGLRELGRWTLPKRKAWKPTGAAVLDLAFDADTERYWAVASNGLVSRMSP